MGMPSPSSMATSHPRPRDHGEDALQALFLALRIIKTDLEVCDREHGPLAYLGEPGLWLDFP
jgi:hypothetical protein